MLGSLKLHIGPGLRVLALCAAACGGAAGKASRDPAAPDTRAGAPTGAPNAGGAGASGAAGSTAATGSSGGSGPSSSGPPSSSADAATGAGRGSGPADASASSATAATDGGAAQPRPAGDAGAAPVMSYPADTPGGPYRVDDMGPSDPCKDVSITGKVVVEGWQADLWLPGGVPIIRCLIGGGGYLDELARLHHCGVIAQPPPSPAALTTALKTLAQMTGHPELEFTQVIGSGYSAAFGEMIGIATRAPERFLAIFGGGIHEVFPNTPGLLTVPWLGFGGSRDGPNQMGNVEIFTSHLAEAGPKGALYGFTFRWNYKHEQGDSRHLMFPYYHQIIPRRAPPPGVRPTQLTQIVIKRESGWLMSPDDWDSPFPTIAPYADYKGDKGKASWLPDAYMAYVARAYGAGSGPSAIGHTMDTPLVTVQPPCAGEACTPRSAGVKSPVLFEVTAMGEQPQTLELWDGDKRLFAVPGPPFRVSITDWTPGVHAIYGLGTYADGHKVVSKPRTVVVNRPGMSPTSMGCGRDAGM